MLFSMKTELFTFQFNESDCLTLCVDDLIYWLGSSESGEMCAMKEVTLFSDDAKSKECAQHLGQVSFLI